MKEIIKGVPVATIILIYLFVCGVFYLVGFWGIFKIDVFNLIAVTDIPKSFVYPLLITQVVFIFNLITGSIATLIDERKDLRYFVTINKNLPLIKKLALALLTSIKMWVFYILVLTFIFIEDPSKSEFFWGLNSITISYYFIYNLVNNIELKNYIKSEIIRSYLAHILIFFPILCFSTGKIMSLRIYKNSDVSIVKFIHSKNTTIIADTLNFKSIGFISDKYVFSTIDNEKIYIMNTNSVDGIEFMNAKKFQLVPSAKRSNKLSK